MPVDKLFSALNVSASGLSAQRKKLDIISRNIANAHTSRTEDGGPYRRKIAVMQEKKTDGFKVMLRRHSDKLAVSNAKHIQGKSFTVRSNTQEFGVETKIMDDTSALKKVYDPDHPDADAEGYVYMPNVNMISEMVDLINASRSYEANLSAMDAGKKMAKAALEI